MQLHVPNQWAIWDWKRQDYIRKSNREVWLYYAWIDAQSRMILYKLEAGEMGRYEVRRYVSQAKD